jgi:hypothetical protein
MSAVGLLLVLLFLFGFIGALLKWGPPGAEPRNTGGGHCCNRVPELPSTVKPNQNERKS